MKRLAALLHYPTLFVALVIGARGIDLARAPVAAVVAMTLLSAAFAWRWVLSAIQAERR